MNRLALALALACASASIEVITLDGSGTTNPSKYYWNVMDLFMARASPPVKMTYRAIGSGGGQYEFFGVNNTGTFDYTAFSDFGSGDMPIGADDYAALTAAGRTVAHFPFLLGAMSFFHNVPGLPVSGKGGLNMTACLLARVFSRDITTWDHADIVAMNPALSVPAGQNIKVYHRVHSSSTTKGITQYLNAACPSVWTADLVGSKLGDLWPTDTYEAQGSGNMAAALASDEYSIGYIDSGHGHDDGLKEIELQNAAGTFQSSLEAMDRNGVGLAATQALLAGVLPADPTDDFSAVSFMNQAGDYTWPIVAVSYLYIDMDQSAAGDKGPLLSAFLEFILSAEGQELVTDYGFLGIPTEIIAVAQLVIDGLTLPAAATYPRWTFETAATTLMGAGQAQYVISGKRKSWSMYAIANNEGAADDAAAAAAACAAATDVTSLSATVDALAASVAGVAAKADLDDTDDDVKALMQVAYAALVVALATFAVMLWAVYKICFWPLAPAASPSPPPQSVSVPVQEVQMTNGANGGGGTKI